MNDFASVIKDNLEKQLMDLNEVRWLFTSNPERDFTRNRKLDFQETIRILLSIGGKSLNLELLDYFDYDVKTVTKSAFVQRREKILPQAFETLFHMFNSTIDLHNNYEGYQLLAVDGSTLHISHNPNDKNTYYPNGPKKGFNLLHLNAMYDLCNRVYVDALVQPKRKCSERQALIEMVDRATSVNKTIVIADRGYESYNICEHITQKGWDYIIRVKDFKSSGIVKGLNLPDEDSFDIDFSFELTRSKSNKIKAAPEIYKYLSIEKKFDFLPLDNRESYPFKFRLLRFPITETTYEVIMTSLNREVFPMKKIKELYGMRWGIETSFRELKYSIALSNFHAKKVTYILQEIYAKLTMYNFCEVITSFVVIHQSDRKHLYQVNFTAAIAICLHFFKLKRNNSPPNVEALIRKNILPVRPGRKDPRKVRPRATVSFLYRVA